MVGADEKALSGSALLGRIGDVRDIASAVGYLAEASFVTGQILNVDGGYVIGRR
jgi:NAD(P)-dependent dehydrogenase (short-subunit alcohol dehydrogenase family)